MAKSKRIFELAKELGVKSKAIVEKCHAEGIPQDVIKNHMSTISLGLEQTVREWFAGEAGEAEDAPHTAVERAEKVDIEKAKSNKARPASKSAEGDEDDSGDDSNAVATATATKAPPPPPPTRVSATAPAAPVPAKAPASEPEPAQTKAPETPPSQQTPAAEAHTRH